MSFPNIWPKTARILFNEVLIGYAHLNATGDQYEGPLPPRLRELNRSRLLWLERTEETRDHIGPDGDVVAVDFYDVTYHLTQLPGPIAV